MAVEIGKDDNHLTIDPTSKAMRVILVDSLGVEQTSAGKLTYFIPINLSLSAVFTAGTTPWAMRNGFSKTIKITKILLNMNFDGTAAANQEHGIQLRRFRGVSMSGGTGITSNIVNRDNSKAGSTVIDIRYNNAATLVTTGVEFDSGYAVVLAQPHSVTGGRNVAMINSAGLILDKGEGLAIQVASLTTASQSGLNISGIIAWDEY